MYDFSDRVAVVTGSGRGIGRGTALRLAKEGADLVIIDLNKSNAESTANEIIAMGRKAISIVADVSSASDVGRIKKISFENFNRVDFLINNAGISRYKSILDSTEEDWDQHVDIMAKGTFLMMRAFAAEMMEQKFGRIINLGSYVAQLNCTTKYFGPYCAAKFGIIGLTQVAAQEFAPFVTVNAVGPGDVATDMMEVEWEQEAGLKNKTAVEVKEEYRVRLLLQEFEMPVDIANAIAHLCSDQARHVTGAHHIVSGGLPYLAKA